MSQRSSHLFLRLVGALGDPAHSDPLGRQRTRRSKIARAAAAVVSLDARDQENAALAERIGARAHLAKARHHALLGDDDVFDRALECVETTCRLAEATLVLDHVRAAVATAELETSAAARRLAWAVGRASELGTVRHPSRVPSAGPLASLQRHVPWTDPGERGMSTDEIWGEVVDVVDDGRFVVDVLFVVTSTGAGGDYWARETIEAPIAVSEGDHVRLWIQSRGSDGVLCGEAEPTQAEAVHDAKVGMMVDVSVVDCVPSSAQPREL